MYLQIKVFLVSIGACTGLFGGKPGYISDLYDETVLQEERGISMLSICCR